MEVNQSQAAEVAQEVQTTAPEQSQVMDLDGVSKWTYQGKEYTNDDWHKIFSEYQTLSKSREEYESDKKFSEGLQTDLELVLKDPARAQEFKSVYPKKYHFIVDQALKTQTSQPAQTVPAQTSSEVPKELASRLEQYEQRLQWHEKRAYDAEVQAANAKLDSMLPPLFQKFELANEDEVYAKAESLLNQNQKVTEKTWERLVRESHEKHQKKFDRIQSAKVKEQIEKGQKGADGGPGGAAPGQAPKRRSFADATEDMIAHVRGQAG